MCMGVSVWIYMYLCGYVCMYVCIYVCEYLCVYVFVYACVCTNVSVCTCMHLCVYVCVRKYVYVCMYARACIYVHAWELTVKLHKYTRRPFDIAPLDRQAVNHCYCTLISTYIPTFSHFGYAYHVIAFITVPMKWRKSQRKNDEMSDANLFVAYWFVLGSIPSKPWKEKTNVPNNGVAYPQICMIYF